MNTKVSVDLKDLILFDLYLKLNSNESIACKKLTELLDYYINNPERREESIPRKDYMFPESEIKKIISLPYKSMMNPLPPTIIEGHEIGKETLSVQSSNKDTSLLVFKVEPGRSYLLLVRDDQKKFTGHFYTNESNLLSKTNDGKPAIPRQIAEFEPCEKTGIRRDKDFENILVFSVPDGCTSCAIEVKSTDFYSSSILVYPLTQVLGSTALGSYVVGYGIIINDECSLRGIDEYNKQSFSTIVNNYYSTKLDRGFFQERWSLFRQIVHNNRDRIPFLVSCD